MQDLSFFGLFRALFGTRKDFPNSWLNRVCCIALCVLFGMTAMGQAPQFGETMQIFPQFVTGGGWRTSLTIHNSMEQRQLVTVELLRSDGSLFLNRVVALGASETQTVSVEATPQVTVGWAQLSSNSRFAATLLF